MVLLAESAEGRVAGDEDRPRGHLGGVGADERDPAAVGAPGGAAVVDRARIAVGGERDRAPGGDVEHDQVPALRSQQPATVGREGAGAEAHPRGHRHRPQAAAGRLVEPVIAPRHRIGVEEERPAVRRDAEPVDREPLRGAGGEERIASGEQRACARGGVVAGDLGRGSFGGLELQISRAVGEPGGVERPHAELFPLLEDPEPRLDPLEQPFGLPSGRGGRRRRSRHQGGSEREGYQMAWHRRASPEYVRGHPTAVPGSPSAPYPADERARRRFPRRSRRMPPPPSVTSASATSAAPAPVSAS